MIDGFAIAGYRSFGERRVEIRDLARVNVFIGQNNCGKSNILRFVSLLGSFMQPRRQNEAAPKLDPLIDFCVNSTTKQIKFGLQVKKDGFTNAIFKRISEPFGSSWTGVFPEYAVSVWFDFHLSGERKATTESLDRIVTPILKHCNSQQQQALTKKFRNYTGGSPEQRAADISAAIHNRVSLNLNVHFIDAFRRITESSGDSLSGAGLIKELRKLQSPQLADYESGKVRFARIVNFLRSILGQPTANLEIPAEKDEIYVTLDSKVLPLESLGTGIHELIIMAAAVTLIDDAIFCIEEPEIHLHPKLQKKFTQYITDNTNNQYLITSHSNAFFDLPGVNIYRCWLETHSTRCCLISEARDKHSLLMDLGYRPSDLLQANYVIWVEGPSDRIYLKHWLKAKSPDFIEGLHYIIMFYGGRLLAHLSYDDPEVNDFVHLSRLNRNACIVMDSDKDKARGHINRTKRRVKVDFEHNSCLTWVTSGRTIENYIPEDILNESIAKIHPRTKQTMKWDRFADVTRIRKDKIIDKVSVAKYIVQKPAQFSMLDLETVMNGLIADIQKCNSIEDGELGS